MGASANTLPKLKPATWPAAFRAAAAGALLASLAACGPAREAPEGVSLGPAVKYLCREGAIIPIRYTADGTPPSGAEIDLDGKQAFLKRVNSEEGIRYSGRQIVWTIRDNGVANLIHFGILTYRECRQI